MITKRKVGLALIGIGILIVGGTVAVDLIGAGQWGGFGPSQQAALIGGLLILVIGLTLLPLGDRPA